MTGYQLEKRRRWREQQQPLPVEAQFPLKALISFRETAEIREKIQLAEGQVSRLGGSNSLPRCAGATLVLLSSRAGAGEALQIHWKDCSNHLPLLGLLHQQWTVLLQIYPCIHQINTKQLFRLVTELVFNYMCLLTFKKKSYFYRHCQKLSNICSNLKQLNN